MDVETLMATRPAAPLNRVGQVALVAGALSLMTCWTLVGGMLCGATAVVAAALNFSRLADGTATNRRATIVGGVLGLLGLVVTTVLIVYFFATVE